MKYVLIIIGLLLIFVLVQVIMTRRLIAIGIGIAESTVPFERVIEDAEISILVIGDSTAVGVGAESPELSIAGRVAETFPEASITNMGISGEKATELVVRFEALEGRYDLIMVHIGGNDAVRFTDLAELEKSMMRILELAKSKADNVTLTSSGSLGTAKLLPLGTRWIFGNRTRKVRDIFARVAEAQSVPFAIIFREKKDDPFAADPSKYYAADFFHPSGVGYEDWYKIISKVLDGIRL